MDRTILHCDLNGFFAGVECVLNPALKDVPMVVAGNSETRHGIVLAKNELAKKFNIQTAETIWQAQNKCKNLVMVPPQMKEYTKYSKLVNEIYCEFTDLVEPFGIDESWLDVTGVYKLFGSGEEIAKALRERVKERLGLTISVGISFNKIFAKLGSDLKKPDAQTLITKENYKQIIHPLPVSNLLYVGKSVKETLSKLYINTIGDLANSDRLIISKNLGKMGEMIHDYANGIDETPVTPFHEAKDIKSVGNGLTFKRDLIGFEEIRLGVMGLADEVAHRLRKMGAKCFVVAVTIKNPTFKSVSKQKTLSSPTHLSKEITNVSMELIRLFWNEKAPIRTITITASNLTTEDIAQLSIFENNEKQEKIEQAMHTIREKYGKKSIKQGAKPNVD